MEVAGDPAVWRSIGLVVDTDGLIPLEGTALKIVPTSDGGRRGIVAWAVSGIDEQFDGTEIDGLATRVVDPQQPSFGAHRLGASGLDHVVVLTPDLERTTGSIATATGYELKRVREVGAMRQGFHRMGRGGLIVEVVTRPEIAAGPASFWGLVVNVDDLDRACATIGDGRISPPKDAVQAGRRIATISDDVGLGLPVALMTT